MKFLFCKERYYDENGNPKKGIEEKYPKYDDYDAINVDRLKDIPMDYEGKMGVPITFLDYYNPDNFELIDMKRLKIKGKEKYCRIIIKKREGYEND